MRVAVPVFGGVVTPRLRSWPRTKVWWSARTATDLEVPRMRFSYRSTNSTEDGSTNTVTINAELPYTSLALILWLIELLLQLV